jgi:hypothetical protein
MTMPAGSLAIVAAILTPAQAHAELDEEFSEAASQLVGRWRCEGQSEAGPWGPKTRFVVEIETTAELGGRMLRTTGSQTSLDAPVQTIRFSVISAVDVVTGQVVRVEADSLGGLAQFTSTGWRGGKIVLEGHGSSKLGRIRMRHTLVREGDGAMAHAMEIAPDGERFVRVGGDRCRRLSKMTAVCRAGSGRGRARGVGRCEVVWTPEG